MAVDWLVFHVTDRCQLNCKHCLRDPDLKPKDMDLQVFCNVLDQAKRIYQTEHVGLTGGEPTLHPQFPQFLDAIVERGMTWHMVTNGIRFDSKVVKYFDEDPRRGQCITAMDFSVDGATQETHDRIRGEGSYKDLMKAISICNVRGIPFLMQMTINAYNAHEIEQFGLGAAELGAKRVSYGMTQPTGTYLDRDMFLSATQWKLVQERIQRLAALLTVPVTHTEGFHNTHPFHECEPFRSEILHVDYTGHLNLCCMHSGVPNGEGPSSEAIADLTRESLTDGHRKMLEMVHQYRLDKIDDMEAKPLEGWDEFPCNYCLKYFGKPHWTESGTSGAIAQRPRWRGAWSPERHKGSDVPVTDRLRVIH